jgi:hypothetical protein
MSELYQRHTGAHQSELSGGELSGLTLAGLLNGSVAIEVVFA